MKTLSLIILTALVLVVVTVVPLQAQSSNTSGALRVTIPVQFTVGTQKLPAGDYIVAPVFDKSIALRNADGGKAVVALTDSVGGGSKVQGPKLVFNRYGDRYFLAEVWLGRADTGRQLFASAEEIELARVAAQKSLTVVAGK